MTLASEASMPLPGYLKWVTVGSIFFSSLNRRRLHLGPPAEKKNKTKKRPRVKNTREKTPWRRLT